MWVRNPEINIIVIKIKNTDMSKKICILETGPFQNIYTGSRIKRTIFLC